MNITHHTYPGNTTDNDWQHLATEVAEILKGVRARMKEEGKTPSW